MVIVAFLCTKNRCNFDFINTLAALTASCSVAEERGKKHDGFEKTMLAQGKFHFELYEETFPDMPPLTRTDWESLRERIKKFGVANSLVTAQMPTAGSSIIMDVHESFEPLFSLVMVRKTLGKNESIINKYLLDRFEELPEAVRKVSS